MDLGPIIHSHGFRLSSWPVNFNWLKAVHASWAAWRLPYDWIKSRRCRTVSTHVNGFADWQWIDINRLRTPRTATGNTVVSCYGQLEASSAIIGLVSARPAAGVRSIRRLTIVTEVWLTESLVDDRTMPLPSIPPSAPSPRHRALADRVA